MCGGVQGVLIGFTQTAIVVGDGQVGFVRLALACQLGQGHTAFHHMAPVVLAGVLYQHQHLANATQRSQGFNRLHGQRGHAKHHQTVRHTCRALAFGQALHRVHEGVVHVRA